jgi:hypothetical protein
MRDMLARCWAYKNRSYKSWSSSWCRCRTWSALMIRDSWSSFTCSRLRLWCSSRSVSSWWLISSHKTRRILMRRLSCTIWWPSTTRSMLCFCSCKTITKCCRRSRLQSLLACPRTKYSKHSRSKLNTMKTKVSRLCKRILDSKSVINKW